ncbi:MAG: sodium:solute symporter [Ignavibacteriales bacterium]|nr:sodium:solute symporter [Ignavibacteriales bacterium]
MHDWLSILPPLVAIVLAIWTRQVFTSLFLGIWLGWVILTGGILTGLTSALQACIDVFKDSGNTRVIIFSSLIGALITLTQRSGGVQGFVDWIHRKHLVRTSKGATVLAWITGMSIFIESSITCLVTGAVARPLFERFKLSREKLAYICDSTSAPVCVLIPLNAWGAYVLGLLEREGVENPVHIFFQTIPLNFYALLAVALVGFISFTFLDFGPMRRAEKRASETGRTIAENGVPLVSVEVTSVEAKPGIRPRAVNMLVPILGMVGMMPLGLFITGNGDMTAGSGSTSVLWSVLLAILLAGGLAVGQKILTVREVVDLTLKGMGGLIPLGILMNFAFAIGDTTKILGTGPYVASVVQDLINPSLVAPIIFVTSAFIAFSTGTSWGTFAIMIPIAVPTAVATGSSLPLTVAALLSGGVFGDHSSPISDTTLVSSMAAASDHIDHVRTQLPYALVSATGALLLFTLAGFLLQ